MTRGRRHRRSAAPTAPARPGRRLVIPALVLALSGALPSSPAPRATAAAGAADTRFGTGGTVVTAMTGGAAALGVAVQADGRIVAAGSAEVDEDPDFALARYEADGSLDTGFNASGMTTTAFNDDGADNARAHAVVVQPDGRIVAAGGAGSPRLDFALARYRPDGSLDETLNAGGRVTTAVSPAQDDVIHALAVQPDGKLVAAGGAFRSPPTNADFALARYRLDGSLDTGFGNGGTAVTVTGSGAGAAPGQEPFAHAVALQPDGRIVAGGSAIVDGNLDFAVVRYTPSGAPDPTFGGGDGVVTTPVGVEEDEIRALVVQDDGRIVVAGWSATGGSTDVALARYTADGAPDPTFGPSGNGTVVTALSPDEDRASGMIADAGGNVVVAGWAVVDDRARIALARYGAGGGLDISFGNDGVVTTPVAGVDAGATSIARRGDGGIVVAGAAGSIPSGAVLLPAFTGFALASYLGDPVMAVSDATVTEGDGGQVSASFRVLLSSPAGPHGARATYATADDTAVASADYAPTSGVVEVAPGATEATVAVAVRGDRGDEAAERFLLRLSEPSGAVLGRSEGVATIVDDEELVIDTVAGAPLLFERVVVRPSVDDDAVLVRVCSDPRRSPCVDLSGLAPGAHPNPLLVEGTSFTAGQPGPEPATTVRSIPGGTGLDTTAGLEIHLASPAPAVELTFAHAGTPPRVVAVSTDGSTTPTVDVPGPAGQPNAVRLPAPGGAAVAQQPFAVAAADRYVYVADPVNHLVRFLDPRTGDGCPCESVFAGNGARGAAAPGADPLATELAGPYAIAPRRTAPGVVAEMYVADTFGHRVLRIAPPAPPAPPGAPPTVAVVAGTGALGFSGDGGPGPAAQLNSPYGVAHDDARGITYVADTLNHRIRAVGADGTIATIAGDGAAGYSGDGGAAAAARLNSPRGLVVDGAGNLYVADTSNNAVRRIDPSGTILTLAGTGVAGFSGDGGLAFLARLDQPAAVAVDDESPPNLFVADTMNHRIRRVDGGTGRMSTLAGTGDEGFSGDNGDALAADLNAPFGVAVRPDGDVVVADTGNARVRVVGAAGPGGMRPIRTLAGNGTPSHPPASVTPATAGPLAGASAVATWVRPSTNPSDDPRPRLVTFVADPFDHSVKMIDRNGRLRVIAGNGRPGYSGDGGPAAQARLFSPFGLALDRSSPPEALFVADTLNNVVRRIELNLSSEAAGTITTVAGDGTAGHAGDGGPATAARLSYPTGVSLDVAGNLYVADAYNARVRRVDPGGTVTTFAGTGRLGSSGDGGPASDADLFFPYGLAADDATPANVYVADSFNHRVRRIEGTSGTVTTVAGTGIPGDGPEGVAATAAALHRPWGVAVGTGPAGDVFIADSLNNRVRRVDAASGLVSTLAANGQPGRQGDLGPAVRARVSEPRGVAPVEASGVDDVVMVADSFSNRVRQVGLTVARVFSEPVRFTAEAFDVGCQADCPVRAVSITNRGHNTLTVDQVALAGPAAGDYRVARDGCSDRKVPPGSGCVVQVTFAPTASCPGPAPCRNAVLRVGGNGADSVREVRLLGAVDVPTCFGRRATFVGTRGDDVIVASEGPDVIHGGPGNDRITGLGGDDVICGGEGDDGADALGEALDGGPGNDIVLGGPGNDAIMGNAGDDVLMGDDGDDYLDGGVGGCCDLATNTGNDILFGGAGNDRLFAADFGSAYMAGEAGNDALNGYDGADTLVGGSGNDTEISAGGGEDLVDVRDGVGDNDGGNAGPGDDTCRTDDGPEVILECLDDPPDPVG